MGSKSSGGGSPSSGNFSTNISGPPPGNATVGNLLYIDLGLIPVGYTIWLGNATFASPDKSITFEIRTSNVGKSLGNDANTTLLSTGSVGTRSGTVTRDLFKSGTLHIVTNKGTGVERFWLCLRSKSSTQGSYMYSINYTTE